MIRKKKELFIRGGDTELKGSIKIYKALKFGLIGLGLGAFLAFIARSFILFPYKAGTSYMEPALVSGKTYLFTKIFSRVNLKQGDIVMVRHPLDKNSIVVSRIVGKENEMIRLEDKNIFINNRLIGIGNPVWKDKRILPMQFSERDTMKEIMIPEDHYFLLSDNRDEAPDSRSFGPISRDLILGRKL